MENALQHKQIYSEAQIYISFMYFTRKISFWNRVKNLQDEGHRDKMRAELDNYVWIPTATSFVQF